MWSQPTGHRQSMVHGPQRGAHEATRLRVPHITGFWLSPRGHREDLTSHRAERAQCVWCGHVPGNPRLCFG